MSQDVRAAEGGVIEIAADRDAALAGVLLEVPAGALAQDTRITVHRGAESTVAAGATSLGPVVVFGPPGTVFQGGARLTLPFTPPSEDLRAKPGAEGHGIYVQVTEAGGSQFRLVPVSVLEREGAGRLVVTIQGFTSFEAAFGEAGTEGEAEGDAGGGPGVEGESDGGGVEGESDGGGGDDPAGHGDDDPVHGDEDDEGGHDSGEGGGGHGGGHGDDGEGEGEHDGGGMACDSDADCPEGHVCDAHDGACEMADDDDGGGHGDDGEGEGEHDGGGMACGADADCPEGHVCDAHAGTCQMADDDDGGEGEGEHGDGGGGGMACGADADCPEGHVCDAHAGTCQMADDDDDDGGCDANADCPQGQVCDLHSRTCRMAHGGGHNG